MNSKIKETSYGYGSYDQDKQIKKYKDRANNHWKYRIKLAQNLLNDHILNKIQGKDRNEIVVLDIGCSIGTFAIEFAKLGFRCFGVDFDQYAIDAARKLAQEEGVDPTFICDDVSSWIEKYPPIDIAVCFDIFEHLHDDELGSLLYSMKNSFSQDGFLMFHTFPTQYDHLLFDGIIYPYPKKDNFVTYRLYRLIAGSMHYPLLPFKYLSVDKFQTVIKIYASVVDIILLMVRGKTYKEIVKKEGHCNLLTMERLVDIIKRAGYEIIFMQSSQLYPFFPEIQKRFAKQPITHRNLYGVIRPKRDMTRGK